MDVAREIAQIQNCQLSSEVKSMLLSSYSTQDIALALEINEPSTRSSADNADHENLVQQATDVGDTIPDRKDESPSLSSPQQQKAKSAIDPFTEEKSLFDKDVPPSKNSTAATSKEVEQHVMNLNPLQKGENHDPKEKMKEDHRDHDSVNVDGESEKIEEPLSSQENQQPKENVAPGSEMNLKEKSASNGTEKDTTLPQKDTSRSSSEIDLEEIAIETNIKASTQVVPTESRRIFMENEIFVIKMELESNSNGIVNSIPIISGKEDESTIHKQKAICRHCSVLISQESRVFNAKCECTKTSLIHKDCKDAWSRVKGDKCSHCDQQIQCTTVMVASIPSQTCSGENPEMPISSSWCCLW